MSDSLPLLAGSVSTALFVASALPMLYKALRTRDMGSYSVGNIVLANLGNALYAVYVFSLPPGPVWALHSFTMVTNVAMLVWYFRFEHGSRRRSRGVEQLANGRGRHDEEGVPADGVELGLSDLEQVYAQPPAMTHIRRPEEPFRLGLDEVGLDPVRRGAPDGQPAVAMMVGQKHDEAPLVADEERRPAVARAL